MKRQNIFRLAGLLLISPMVVGLAGCDPDEIEKIKEKLNIEIIEIEHAQIFVENPNGNVIGATAYVDILVENGYEVVSVKHNGVELVKDDFGKYPFVFAEDNKIEVEVKAKEEEKPTPNPDPDPNPDVNPNPNNRNDYFDSERVKNMATRDNLGSVDDYYASVKGLKGEALKDALYTLCQPRHRFDYDHLKQSFPYTDVDPDNPSMMYLWYTGEAYPVSSFRRSGWSYVNREHVWPNSKGAGKSGPGSDKHMLRVCEQKINSTRSNKEFATVYGGDLGGINAGNKSSGKYFEPKDEFKGDTARTIFYLATIYNQMELARPSDTSRYNYWSASYTHGRFEDLYEWATNPSIDPVSKFEMHHNNQVDILYQNNRNPFIDHPEFIEIIYDKNYSGPGALL